MMQVNSMKCSLTARLAIAVWMMPIGLTVAAAQNEPPVRQSQLDELKGSRNASCILRLPAGDPMIPVETDFINSIMMTSAVRGGAIRETLHRGGEILLANINVSTEIEMIGGELMTGDELAPTLYRLTVAIDEEDGYERPLPPVAEELQSALVARLRQALMQLSQQNAVSLHKAIGESEARLKLAQDRLDRLCAERRAMSTAAGRIDLDRGTIATEIVMLERQLRDLEIERVAQQARQSAIEAQIAKSAERQAKQADSDPILADLQHLVDIQQLKLERIQQLHKANQVSEGELAAARESLIEARIRLQERREGLAASDLGADRSAALNTELAEAGITSAESEARTEYIRNRLKQLTEQLEIADRLESTVELGFPAAQAAVSTEMERLATLQSRMDAFRPAELEVVGVGDGDLK
ncbi:MAG: hypothetical protein H6818_08950 [Phycisphaerales bacterium]|nr:hypothetical protein [Phycisphaerales bacterium]MCB9862697.1 hypothetical protein [Phycisphaerales bacterium]